jgi:hypothetical protein
MSQPPEDTDTEPPSAEADDAASTTLDRQLRRIKQLRPRESDGFKEVGIYSIHERDTSRLLTLPTEADGFDDALRVKQFYIDDTEQPMLIIVPVTA